MWLVFSAVVAVAAGLVAACCADLRDVDDSRESALGHLAEYVPAPLTVLSHVAADGSVLEFPIIRGESVVSLATTLGEIASLPEVAA